MELREGLERIVEICSQQSSCIKCPLNVVDKYDDESGCVFMGGMLGNEHIDKIVQIVEQQPKPMTAREAQDYVIKHLPIRDKLEQLAEEAAELAQAAIKLIRACGNTNPTPISAVKAEEKLIEEVGDVLACLIALEYKVGDMAIDNLHLHSEKWIRWAERIKNGGKE